MPEKPPVLLYALVLSFASLVTPLLAQKPANANPTYQQLRSLLPGGEVIQVENLVLHRDAATFTLRRGGIAFFGEVNGKITGAVFQGDGNLHLVPPTPEERHNLALFNKTEEFDEDFDRAVLRFTDGTAAELHKTAAAKGQPDTTYGSAVIEANSFLRTKLGENTHLRLIEDVLSPSQGGYFRAILRGKKHPRLVFTLDPHGAPDVAPEEVSLLDYNDWGASYPAAFHLSSEAGGGSGKEENGTYAIDHEDLDITIEKGGFLSGLATLHLVALQDGLAVVPLNLYPTLRVSRAETEKGETLDFVQEKKDEDADFGVILAKPLGKGEAATIRIAYGGKDVVRNEGGANYYPVARQSWYPNRAEHLGSYATYHMLFHVPKGLELLATGTRVNERTEGKYSVSEWNTDVPLPVVGFNLGKFVSKEATAGNEKTGILTIAGYANQFVPDSWSDSALNGDRYLPRDINSRNVESDASPAIGTINTTSMLPVTLSQGQMAAEIYAQMFGSLPFKHLALTQQFACNYGQSWPMLVYIPICGFLDATQQHFLGLHPEDMYWKVVTPHEVAHQWWGQAVGFASYRDQWMSEGFADASASIYLQITRPKSDDFRNFWKEQRRTLVEKNAEGFRPIDVGPVTMGFRLSNSKTGWNIYRDLVYPKGAYILHMLRMMMWTPREGDARFSATMRDFLDTYRLKPASTEDFKAIVEKHMSQAMDLDENHRMDWFFREYVYGTELPTYHFESQVSELNGAPSLHFKLTQLGISEGFRNLVPVYLEFADGRVHRLGLVNVVGSNSKEATVPLPQSGPAVKRAFINYSYDVLCLEN